MEYAELPCAPELTPWLACHWVFRVAPGAGVIEHRIPLTGGAISSVGPDGVPMVSGPRSAPLVVEVRDGELYRGTHVQPWATASLFGDPARVVERVVPLAEVLDDGPVQRLEAAVSPDLANAAALALLDGVWASVVAGAGPLDLRVARGALRIVETAGREPIREVAARGGLSPRQFRRRFRAASGLSPKELARIRRARSTAVDLASRADGGWADRAAGHGYADQAHLTREYRRLFGANPTEVERHLRRIAHGTLLR